MNSRFVIFLILIVFSSTLFSACTSVESKEAEEIIITDTKTTASDEIVISDSDFIDKTKPISTVQQGGEQPSRILADGSKVETIVDSFGNKVETRYFSEHPRLQFVMLRTSVDGKQEVTVYGYSGNTKVVPDLGELAMSGSPDEIANAVGIYGTRSVSRSNNFMKSDKPQTQTTLQPLPSSAFQRPVSPVVQSPEPAQTEMSNNIQDSTTQPRQVKED